MKAFGLDVKKQDVRDLYAELGKEVREGVSQAGSPVDESLVPCKEPERLLLPGIGLLVARTGTQHDGHVLLDERMEQALPFRLP